MTDFTFTVDSKSLAPVQNAVIKANFDECRAALTEMMAPYAGLVVTEDGMTAAKADRARINKVAANIDDARKMVKKAYSAPLNDFENKCKELTGICQTAAKNLDDQVKTFELKRKEEKLDLLLDYFMNKPEDLREYLPWARVMNSKWGNATYGIEKAKAEIDAAVKKVGDDLETIKAMRSKYEPELLQKYKVTLDIAACVRKQAELDEIEKRLEERKKAAEEEAKKPEPVPEPEPENRVVEEAVDEDEGQVELMTISFTCVGTREQLMGMANYMKRNGIRYKKVGE